MWTTLRSGTLSTDDGVSTDLTPEPPSAIPESPAEPAPDPIVSETADSNSNQEDDPVHTVPSADSQMTPKMKLSTRQNYVDQLGFKHQAPDYFSQ